MENCSRCHDTGVIETGNNDLPCDCVQGDIAKFNVAGLNNSISGKLLKKLNTENIEMFCNPEEKLKFSDLKVGDVFISFPIPGDNSGHGGYKGKHFAFIKIEPVLKKNSRIWHENNRHDNARRINDSVISSFVGNFEVIQIG